MAIKLRMDGIRAVPLFDTVGEHETEYLSLTEHQHILAEKEKRIERLREATNSALKSIGWFMQDGNIERLEDEAKLLRAVLQEETK